MKKLGLVLAGLYCSVISVLAEETNTALSPAEDMPLDSMLSHGTMYEAGIIRPIISLAIVIGLIYITAFVYKKLSGFNEKKFIKESGKLDLNKFKLISSQPLGANKTLHVVEINGKYLVLGSTTNSISLIKEFDKASIEHTPSLQSNSFANETQETSSDWMADILNKYNGEENEK